MLIITGGNYSVYVHINLINGKMYVGATRKIPIYKRWGNNGSGYRRNKNFYNEILEFGWDNFEHEIVASGLNEEEASNMEKLLIKNFDTTNPENGYNIERGGLNHAEDERCQKISESLKGEKHFQYGKPLKEETKEKIRNSLSGEKGFWYGKKLPQETIDKMSNALKGRVINTEKFIAHAESVRKPIMCVETGETFSSIKEASIKLNINHVPISRAANGKQQTAFGKHWKFV